MNDPYGQELHLWLNLILPSVKFVKKARVGSRVRSVYDAARTPFERVRECTQADPEKVAQLEELRKRLDPFQTEPNHRTQTQSHRPPSQSPAEPKNGATDG
jgi:hypothetical protein